MLRREMGLDMEVWKSAVGSGHGIGKSAFVAWVIYFFMSTRVDTRGNVTASTQYQLEDKTWPELSKWHNLAINKHWFFWSATAFTFAAYPEERRKNYRISALSVSKDNTEAFQGLHNAAGSTVIIFDEASGVLGEIWAAAEGALSDGEAFFFAFGNMTRPDGDFVDCFEKYGEYYRTTHVDSREVSFTNKAQLNEQIEKYGFDSDRVRVRVRGMPPRQSVEGFMDYQALCECAEREDVVLDRDAGLIMAVDSANTGGDEIVIAFRQGWDARSRGMIVRPGMRHPDLVKWIASVIDKMLPDAIVIECVGAGIPLCDDLEELGYKIFRAYPGAQIKHDEYVNQRVYWYSLLRDWVYEFLSAMPEDPKLVDQLAKLRYYIRKTDGKTLMESKRDLIERTGESPDRADALMLTFATKVPRRNLHHAKNASRRNRVAVVEDNPLGF